ncbi:HD-GYP domain-containing protein [Marinobacter sp. CHS3-4]|uniref:HD-GYP domain-containing protein n=1 Tax=Marinobacter sp. CHS3-4 TaxID=3045174 RepID=UPI0024B4B58A|nr:HD-GYP domain-containing protein [Marinobacter sp. CHS3-4]MDI9243924.1 HD-GYP domain-containing protein [Marinobacter sp. CHS3-4]
MGFRSKTSRKTRAKTATPTAQSGKGSSSLQRVRLPVDLLRAGMRVVKLDRPWTEVPVLFQGFTIDTDEQAGLLRHYCEWVVVENEIDVLEDALDQAANLKTRTLQPLPETRSLNQELPRASVAWRSAHRLVSNLTRSIEMGHDLKLDEARPVITQCVDSIKANASAMFWMSRVKSRDAYTAEHCVRVAIFAVAFARFLGMPDEDLHIVGLCGLLHDLGKLQVPDSILNKPGPLSAEEMAIMKDHTQYGYKMLRADTSLDSIVSDVSRHHHERIDGRGYPDQLEEWQISRFARLVSIIDAYDAMTSDRCYRDGMPASDAIRVLYQNRGAQFDVDMVEAFIRMVGIYPPGTLVELSTGEVALVVAVHPGKKLKPRVEVLLDADKQAIEPRLIDLGDLPTGTVIDIAHPLPDGSFGLSLNSRIQQLVKQNTHSASNSL